MRYEGTTELSVTETVCLLQTESSGSDPYRSFIVSLMIGRVIVEAPEAPTRIVFSSSF